MKSSVKSWSIGQVARGDQEAIRVDGGADLACLAPAVPGRLRGHNGTDRAGRSGIGSRLSGTRADPSKVSLRYMWLQAP